ncbi:TPA: hypothetical protein DCG86_00900 [Candidatus Marinimicrobia bacterium]|nr:MAG: Uncharacterized protein XE04_0010 [Marinimicrobia bacterium 46_43]HAE86563.1 hypothetical protein [Candidatus Neomarinimicrobiota bacterium]HBY18653.1 hypothetical protein [Candidatus Neomarinimicrobiota bacterium]
MKPVCYFYGILFLVSGLWAQNISTHVEPDSGYIGDAFTVTYSITLPDQARIEPPRFEESIPDLRLLSQSSDTRFDEGQYTRIFTLQVTAFDTGYQIIPAVPFKIQQEGDKSFKTISSDSMRIRILSAIPKVQSPPEVYEPLPVPLFTLRQKIILALLLVLLILAVICIFHRRRTRIPEGIKGNSLVAPFDEAEQSFQTLEEREYLEKGEWKTFYLELTTILKRYIERTFYLHITDLPTAELIPVLKKEIPDMWTEPMSDLIRYSDLVKFARLESSIEQGRQDLKQAREWCKMVERTQNSLTLSEETKKSS